MRRPDAPFGALVALLLGLSFFLPAAADVELPLRNWTAPLYWSSAASQTSEAATPVEKGGRHAGREALALPSAALPFIAITPCRVADTRDVTFPPGFGIPMLNGGGAARPFVIPSGPCPGIPATAAAYSLNFTVVAPAGTPAGGYLSAWPTGSPQPIVSTLNFTSNSILANAAIVPAGTGGSISLFVNFSTDLIIDINGYYAGTGVVTTLNTLKGDVALAAGTDLTLTPAGQTLTLAANSASASTASTLVRRDASGNFSAGTVTANLTGNVTGSVTGAASLNVLKAGDSMTGTLTINPGNLNLVTSPSTSASGNILKNGTRFIHNFGPSNTFVGIGAGNFTVSGAGNTGVGSVALANTTTGANNTVIGWQALLNNSDGGNNTAVGSSALSGLSVGDGNTAIGGSAGSTLAGGNYNIYIGNVGASVESNTIRIGGSQTRAFISGIRGVTTANANAVAVLIDSAGQLGTVSSSARVKEDVRDMADASASVMQLRPVTFRYKGRPDLPEERHYGLIAEEVDEVVPELVARSSDGQIESVKYHELPAMLLNELQKERRASQALLERVRQLEERLERAEARLQKVR